MCILYIDADRILDVKRLMNYNSPPNSHIYGEYEQNFQRSHSLGAESPTGPDWPYWLTRLNILYSEECLVQLSRSNKLTKY